MQILRLRLKLPRVLAQTFNKMKKIIFKIQAILLLTLTLSFSSFAAENNQNPKSTKSIELDENLTNLNFHTLKTSTLPSSLI